jgi:PKD repeat protein
MKNVRVYALIVVILVSIGIVAGALVSVDIVSQASNQQPVIEKPVNDGSFQTTQPSDWTVVRIYYEDQAHLNAVAGELDIWEVYQKDKYAIAAVPPAQYHWLEVSGYDLEVDEEKTALLQAPAAPLDPRYYYFDDFYPNPDSLYMVDFLQEINITYPEFTELYDVGDAWMAGQPGEYDRDIWVLRITNEDPVYGAIEDKPPFFLFAGIHAREVVLPELAIRYINYLINGYNDEGGYGLDPDVTWLVNHNVIYILVSQNPDGHWKNEESTSNNRRKNMDWDDGCSNPSSWGVDLNRNHSFFWGCCGGSSGNPCDTTYRGPLRTSEPETQAFQNFFATVIPDQNGPNGDDEFPMAAPDDTTGIFISLHSTSDLILWPWDLPQPPPNEAELEAIGRKLGYLTGYFPGPIGYPVDGSTDDWTYGKFGIPSFVYEVGSGSGVCGGFFPPYDCIDGYGGRNFWAETKPSFIYAHKLARTPYMTIYGPDTDDTAAVPGVVSPGEPATLMASIADHRYGNDPLQLIAAAEYFINAPGDDGTGTPMNPADGSWGDLTEVVTSTLDTTALPMGQHYILIHGQNDSGDWGPFTAVFLNVMEPGVAPVIEGNVYDISNNYPIDAKITADPFQSFTDPATGYYSMTVLSGTYDISAIAEGYAISIVNDVTVENYQIIQQDFYLAPMCDVFTDTVEFGNQDWTPQGQWAITDEAANSPTHSWTDSPGGNYGNNWNYSLISQLFDLSEYEGITLSFWHIYDLEATYDFGYVEYSTTGGAPWTIAKIVNGEGQNQFWSQEVIYLPELDHQENVRIQFRIQTDGSVTEDGWHIDDIRLSGGGTACYTPIAPVADFTSNSPVAFGEPVEFTNLTDGTSPIIYEWDFGDGVGTSTETHPSYIYPAAGTYTVNLTATNSVGSDTASHQVLVTSTTCTEITGVELTLVTSGTIYIGDMVEFSLDVSPDAANKPYNYTVNYGDGTLPITDTSSEDPLSLTHQYNDVGIFNVDVSAINCGMVVPLDDSVEVIVSPVYTDLLGVELSLVTTGTIYTGQVVDFSADFSPDDASKPYTYTVEHGDGTSPVIASSDADPLPLTHMYAITGTFTVELTALNAGMFEPVTDTISLNVYEPSTCVDLTGITILGPTSGFPGVYTFTTTYEPTDATHPIMYQWDNGNSDSTTVRTFSAGAHTISVTATNCITSVVTDTHMITITPTVDMIDTYLPLVINGSGSNTNTGNSGGFSNGNTFGLLPIIFYGLVLPPFLKKKE